MRLSPNSKHVMFCLLSALLASCSPSSETQPVVPVVHVSANAKTWSWESYPLADRVTECHMQGQVVPEGMAVVRAPSTGLYRLVHADKFVEAGNVIAEMTEPLAELRNQRISLEREVLALQQEQLRLQQEDEGLKLEQEIKKVAKHIADLERAKALLEDPLLLEELHPGVNVGSLDQDLSDLREQMNLLSAQHGKHVELEKKRLSLEMALKELELKMTGAERDLALKQASLVAPAHGQIHWAVPWGENENGEQSAWLRAEDDLGWIEDDRRLLVRVALLKGRYLTGEAKDLLACPQVENAPSATFLRRELVREGERMKPHLIFVFDGEAATQMATLKGGQVELAMQRMLPQKARIVPKLHLLMYQPESFSGVDWNEGIAKVFPGAQVLAVGLDSVAVLPSESIPLDKVE